MDFEFLLDASGSITSEKWSEAVTSVADDWIINAIKPVYGEFGNHVAARWFSSNTERFIDFQESSFPTSGHTDYAEYVASIMRNAPYEGRHTYTGTALGAVYSSDLITSRQLGKENTIVFVFTDGQSDDAHDTIHEATELRNHATVFSVAIGTNVDADELNAISSTGVYIQIEDVTEIQSLMNSVLVGGGTMQQNAACKEYDCSNIFRNADPMKMRTKGCSSRTGKSKFK